jgi:phosphoribosylglycinamide formyltransferase-1
VYFFYVRFMKTAKIGVLVSGRSRGSNFAAILAAIANGTLHAQVALLVATNEEHGAVALAREAGVEVLVLPPTEFTDAEDWDHRAADAFYQAGVSLVCLAGYLRFLTRVLLEAFPRRILNVHPSLLPAFGGQGMYGIRVHRAVIEHGCKVSGCTVHFCNEHYDMGHIIAQACVPVEDNDTAETLQERVQKQEHRLYPQCIEWVVQDKLRIEGQRVKFKK